MASSAFQEFLQKRTDHHRAFLEQHGWLDPASGRPRVELVEPLLRAHLGEDHHPFQQEELNDLMALAEEASMANEALGQMPAALAWYRLGAYRWRGGAIYRRHIGAVEVSLFTREDAARFQLPAAVCSDRAGWRERALQLYAWAADNRALTEEEKSRFLSSRQEHFLWGNLPYRAYALACLERWQDALAVVQEAEEALRRDRGARRTESYQAPLKILDMVAALARYMVEPMEEHRRAVVQALHPRSAASPSFGDQMEALFYLFNLRARHPELVADTPSRVKPEPGPKTHSRLSHPKSVSSLVFSPDGLRLAVGLSNGQVWLWKMPEAEVMKRWSAHPNSVQGLAFSPDGHLLATAANRWARSREPNLRVWDAGRGKRLHDLRGHEYSLAAVAFTPDGLSLASAGEDASVRLWDVAGGRELRSWNVGEPLDALAVEPGGAWLAAGGGSFHGRLFLIPLQSGDRRVLEDHQEDECLADPDEPVADHTVTRISVGAGDVLVAGALDGTIQVWEVNQGRLRWKQEGAHSYEGVTGIAAVGDHAISAGWDGFVNAWHMRDGQALWQLKHEAPIQAMATAVDGAWLALGFGDGSVALYTLAEGR